MRERCLRAESLVLAQGVDDLMKNRAVGCRRYSLTLCKEGGNTLKIGADTGLVIGSMVALILATRRKFSVSGRVMQIDGPAQKKIICSTYYDDKSEDSAARRNINPVLADWVKYTEVQSHDTLWEDNPVIPEPM